MDYCCLEEEVSDADNHFSIHRFMEGRRRYEESPVCHLKIAVVEGKLLFAGKESVIKWCQEEYMDTKGEWFFEINNLRKIEERLRLDGYQIDKMRPYFISETPLEVGDFQGEMRWYENEEIESFRGDDRIHHAFTYDKGAPDVIGVGAFIDGTLIGMAGASADSPTMWQIGIDVASNHRRLGVAKTLVSSLRNKILEEGKLAYYSTGMSHIGSQKVALGCGFKLAWAELFTKRVE